MNRVFLILLTAGALLAASGCYNSKKLLEEARNQAIRTRLDEVQLGEFRTTLPRPDADSSPMEVVVDLFGTVPRYKIPEVSQVIERDDYRVRQAVIIALRKTTAAEIADPRLTTFRERLLTVVNAELGETKLESLGFRTVRFIPL
ncbi:hypothetical protein [Aeoliella sp.]|uniref:hypothetical protein n=1 Tax=Aeoliella sp. TaxID=2795800 RepID=UPI003CCB9484